MIPSGRYSLLFNDCFNVYTTSIERLYSKVYNNQKGLKGQLDGHEGEE